MARPLSASVCLAAFSHNLRLASALSGKQVCPIVKADAYGHGAVALVRHIEQSHPEVAMIGVCSIDEALALRTGGITLPILLLEGIFSTDEIREALQHQCVPAIHSPWQAELLLKQISSEPNPYPVWMTVNTGLNRLGLARNTLEYYTERLGRVGCTPVLMNHYASADSNEQTTHAQYRQANSIAKQYNLTTSYANSACLLYHPTMAGDITRPGIMLYGATPDNSDIHQTGLKPVMSLTSEVIATHTVKQGDCVGYGGTWQAQQNSYIGIIACGYADGYPREISQHAYVCINQVPCRLAGRVSMDLLAVDLSSNLQVKAGDQVNIWGNTPTINQIADWSGTIAYTLLTRLNKRVPIRHINATDCHVHQTQ